MYVCVCVCVCVCVDVSISPSIVTMCVCVCVCCVITFQVIAAVVEGPNPALLCAFEAHPKTSRIITALLKTADTLAKVPCRGDDKV